jgi:hypothetical protein
VNAVRDGVSRARQIRLGQSTSSGSSFFTELLEAVDPFYIGPPPPPGYTPSTPVGQAAVNLYNYNQSIDPLSSLETGGTLGGGGIIGGSGDLPTPPGIPTWVYVAGALLAGALVISIVKK